MMNQDVFDFVVDLLNSYYVPVHRFSLPCPDSLQFDGGLRKSILHINNMEEKTENLLRNILPRKLCLLTDTFQCSYVILRIPDTDELMLSGPVTFIQFQEKNLKELLNRLNFPPELYTPMSEYYQNVPFLPFQSYYLNLFTLLSERLYGKEGYEFVSADLDELDQWPAYYDQYFRVEEQPFASIRMIEARYEDETKLIDAVRSGNETKALDVISRSSAHFIPQRMNNQLRDMKDYCITLNTLLRKAAESAGVHPIHIDALSNQNVKAIEQLTSEESCSRFQSDCVRHYCHLIKKYTLGNYSALTRKVLTYISTDLNADLSLQMFADMLSVSPSYLSALFKKEVGVPLTEYVNRSRIQYAQRLLVTTSLPLKKIAQQCGIPDVYYFSRLFKRITGTTPKAYRDSRSFHEFFDF